MATHKFFIYVHNFATFTSSLFLWIPYNVDRKPQLCYGDGTVSLLQKVSLVEKNIKLSSSKILFLFTNAYNCDF